MAWVAVAMAHILVEGQGAAGLGVDGQRSSFNLLGTIAWFGAAALRIILHVWGGGYADFSASATALVAFLIYDAWLCKVQRH